MTNEDTPALSGLFRMAVIAGTPASVLLHLRRGASVNARDANGATPLMLAMARGRADICKLLLDEGADPRLQDRAGRTVLEYAPASGGAALAQLIRIDDPLRAGDAAASIDRRDRFETAAEATDTSTCEGVNESAAEWAIAPSPHSFVQLLRVEGETLKPVELDQDAAAAEVSLWEAEEPVEAPADDPKLKAAAAALQADIGRHRATSKDEDWSDVDIELPEVAPRRLRDPNRRAELERLRRLFRRSLDVGSYSTDQVLASLASRGDEESEDLAERRSHAAFVTLSALGLQAEDWEEWTTALKPRRISQRHADEADEACQFFELHWSSDTSLELWYRELASRPVPSAEQEILQWRRYQVAVSDACATLLTVPAAVAGLISALEDDLHSLSQAQNAPDAELADEPEDEDEPGTPKQEAESLYGWSRHQLETAVELLRGIQLDLAGADELKKRFLGLVDAHRLPATLIEHLAHQTDAQELEEGLRADIRLTLKRLRRQRDQIFSSHMKLAVWIARRYGWSRLPLEDRIQEANLGLLKAIDRFDPRRGSKFSTYAVWWIRQAVTRAIHDQGRTIRLPVHIADAARRVEVTQERLTWELRRPPVPSEIAQEASLPIYQVERLLRVIGEPLSFEVVQGDERAAEGAGGLADDGQDPEASAVAAELRELVASALLRVNEREERVVRLRFGMNLPRDHTLEEVGQPWDITRERIRQIEAKALQKLKHPSRSRRLRQFLDSGA